MDEENLEQNLKDLLLEQAYQAGRMDERKRVTTILTLDQILLKAKNPEEFLSRALQMVNHEDSF
jgi:hypothetical protein